MALAIRHPLGNRGHVIAYRAQPDFPLNAKIQWPQGVDNPWRVAAPGHAFFTACVLPATTVQQCIDLGAKQNLKASEVQRHLRWLFTWGLGFQVNGQVYTMPTQASPPVQPSAPKGKAKSKATA